MFSLSTSADGETVAFIARPGGAFQLWVGKADGSGQQALTTPIDPRWARFSPNGKQIVYYEFSLGHIFVINPDGTGNLDLTPTLPTGMTSCYDASVSADSTQAVFTCQSNATGTFGIYTVKMDGTAAKTVETRATFYTDYAFFTPDVKKILFIGGFSKGFGVGSVNIDGTGETLLVPSSSELLVLNSSLYYEPCSSPLQIFKANLDGTKPVQISDSTNTSDLYYPNGGGC